MKANRERKGQVHYETEILGPDDIESGVSEEDEPILRDYAAQVNRCIRQKYSPGRQVRVFFRPWPSERILTEMVRRVSERWDARIEPTGWRGVTAFVLREPER
jgi:hypothetical protein